MYIRKIVVTLQYFLLTPKKCSKTAFDKKKEQPRLPPPTLPNKYVPENSPTFFFSHIRTQWDISPQIVTPRVCLNKLKFLLFVVKKLNTVCCTKIA